VDEGLRPVPILYFNFRTSLHIDSPEQDLSIPDLRNVLITRTVILNGISATALVDSYA
jgi:hypothetical protein